MSQTSISDKIVIGDATLYLGDCREILSSLQHVDAVVTDPPYGIADVNAGPKSRAREKGAYETKSFRDTKEYLRDVCLDGVRAALSLAKRAAITCGRTNQWQYPPPTDVGAFFFPACTGISLWGRPTWQPILFYGTAPHPGQQLWPLHRTITEAAEKNGHPCPKPINAWTWVVYQTSKDGETVLDPFMGSGTTGVACARLRRRFIGIEIERRYFDIACKRINEAQQQRWLFSETELVPRRRTANRDLFHTQASPAGAATTVRF